MTRHAFILVLMTIVLTISIGQAQDEPLFIGDVSMPPLKWGTSTATLEITNNTGVVKFITVVVETGFSDSYLNPVRKHYSHWLLPAEETISINPPFEIASNYGRAEVMLRLYDIVDTLDVLIESLQFYEKSFILNIKVPEGMHAYLQEAISLPPMVDRQTDFDNEFSRLVIVLLSEGRSVDEIATLAGTASDKVTELLERYESLSYVSRTEDGFQLNFPVITVAEAEKSKVLADRVADKLVSILERNQDSYWKAVDSLVEAGATSGDSDEYYDGGSVLWRTHTTVGTLLLWYDLGQKFITRTIPLIIYDNTDICEARIPYYMYAVQGGEDFNGTHFFAYTLRSEVYQFLFGDAIPQVRCADRYTRLSRVTWGTNMEYLPDFEPEKFFVDTNVIKPALAAWRGNVDQLLNDTYADLFKIADEFGHRKLLFGHRYWFWNLVATRTLNELIDRGVVSQRGNGQFRLEGQGKIKPWK